MREGGPNLHSESQEITYSAFAFPDAILVRDVLDFFALDRRRFHSSVNLDFDALASIVSASWICRAIDFALYLARRRAFCFSRLVWVAGIVSENRKRIR